MTGRLDRDAARALVVAFGRDPRPGDVAGLLDALEGCVLPDPARTIDRDALLDLLASSLGQHRLDASVAVGVLTDRVLALARPVDGVTLTRDEAARAAWALHEVKGWPKNLTEDVGAWIQANRDLGQRLEATS